MKNKIKLFLPLVLIFSMLLGSTCFASSGGRGGAYIYGDSSLNSEVIRQFNSMSNKEQSDLVRSLSPLLFNRLGFIMNDPYTTINNYWKLQKNRRVNEFTSAEDYLHNTTDEYPYTFVYLNDGEYYWYNELVDYLRNTMTTLGGQLVMNDTNGINFVLNSFVNNYASDMGMVSVHVLSYKNINSSSLGSLTDYDKFIAACENAKSQGYNYIFLQKWTNSAHRFGRINGTLIATGPNNVGFVNNSGAEILTYSCLNTPNYTNGDTIGVSSMTFKLGLSSFSWSSLSGNVVYSLDDSAQDLLVFKSSSAYINANGHFEYPFQVTNYFGRVPSVTVNSNDMTNIYNQIFTDNSNNSVNTNTTTNIYYPNSFEPGSNSYDKDTHKLDFSGVGALLASLGDLIGSLINGFAQGFANIIESITSVARNIMEALAGGLIFEFLKSFMAWLPEPLPSLIFGLFTISVTFAVIRLVKGALS